ncbi:MAG TPA: SRPBCC domain-containing protein, partial [Bacteroidia bacterium]|nr:SRPBCC domain-containing protein [Bacteroidia bacterium]
KNEPKKLISYKYWSSLSGKEDTPENYQTLTYTLSESEGKTKLTITQEGISSEKEKEHSEKNWDGVLKGLKQLVEQDKVSA